MKHSLYTLASLLTIASTASAANFTLVKEYSGSSFFSGWDYFGAPDAGFNNGTLPRTPSALCMSSYNALQAT